MSAKAEHCENEVNRALPPWVTVELTNMCNFMCVMCGVYKRDPLPPGFMDVELFKRFTRDIIKTKLRIENFKIFWLGEPLMHPNFEEIIEFCVSEEVLSKKPFPHIAFDTNASLLDRHKAELLLEAGKKLPVHILVSLDAVTKETYDSIRLGGDFERVTANVKHLISERTRRGQDYPRVLLQIIVQERNRHEVKAFKEHWTDFFKQNGIQPSYCLCENWAEHDGINFKPLEVPGADPVAQRKAWQLFETEMKKIKLQEANTKWPS